MLIEKSIQVKEVPLSQAALRLIREGKAAAKSIDCFDFVPSDYAVLWNMLNALPRTRFCEWGSGIGIATGLAAMLGYSATGVEINPEMALASRRLLASHGIDASIENRSYLIEDTVGAELYFVYCWPGAAERYRGTLLSGDACVISTADLPWGI